MSRPRALLGVLCGVVLVGLAYAAFGVWALAISGMNPFFLIFVVPGILLAIAAWGRAPAATRA